MWSLWCEVSCPGSWFYSLILLFARTCSWWLVVHLFPSGNAVRVLTIFLLPFWTKLLALLVSLDVAQILRSSSVNCGHIPALNLVSTAWEAGDSRSLLVAASLFSVSVYAYISLRLQRSQYNHTPTYLTDAVWSLGREDLVNFILIRYFSLKYYAE